MRYVKPGISGEIYRNNKQLWLDHFNLHKGKIQKMQTGKDRWHYICSHEVNSSHCEPLEHFCKSLGIPVERDKLDFSEIREKLSVVGVPTLPEPPELVELVVVDEERQAIQAEPVFADGGRAPF